MNILTTKNGTTVYSKSSVTIILHKEPQKLQYTLQISISQNAKCAIKVAVY